MEEYFGRQFIDDTVAAMEPKEPFPARSIYASEIGHPCLWFQVAKFTHWRDKPPIDPKLQMLFEQGYEIENQVQQHLKMGGWRIISKEPKFDWDNQGQLRYPLSGRADFVVGRGDDRRGVAIDCKGLQPYDAQRLDPEGGINQFLHARASWLRKYPAQILVYAFMREDPIGALHVVNKANYGDQRTIWFRLDDHLEYVESLLKHTEEINLYLETGEEPPKIDYEPIWCKRCNFFHVCLPIEQAAQGAAFIKDPDLEEKLARLKELEPLSKEFNKLDKQLKGFFKPDGMYHRGEGNQFVGDKYLVNAKSVPKQIKAQEAYTRHEWHIKLKEL